MDSQPTAFGIPVIFIFVVIGLVCALAIILIFTKMRRKRALMKQPISSPDMRGHDSSSQQIKVHANVKRCPTCHSTYTDEALRYCLVDGASLEDALGSPADYDPEVTIRINDKGDSKIAPTVQYHPEMRNEKDNG